MERGRHAYEDTYIDIYQGSSEVDPSGSCWSHLLKFQWRGVEISRTCITRTLLGVKILTISKGYLKERGTCFRQIRLFENLKYIVTGYYGYRPTVTWINLIVVQVDNLPVDNIRSSR